MKRTFRLVFGAFCVFLGCHQQMLHRDRDETKTRDYGLAGKTQPQKMEMDEGAKKLLLACDKFNKLQTKSANLLNSTKIKSKRRRQMTMGWAARKRGHAPC